MRSVVLLQHFEIHQLLLWIRRFRFLLLILTGALAIFCLIGSSELMLNMDVFWASVTIKQNFSIQFLDESFSSSFIILPDLRRCTEAASNPQFLVVILSRPASFAIRNAIRQTWASTRNSAAIKEGKVVVYFVVGVVNDEDVMLKILEENQIYNDLIGVTLKDTYSKLTLKVYAAMYFKQLYCGDVEYFVKMDDDVIIDPDRLLQLSTIFSDSGSIYGAMRSNETVIRNRWNRYYMSKVRYAGTHYPTYAAGMLYIIPSLAFTKIWNAIRSKNWINIEDAFYTGIVAQRAGVRRTNITNWYSFEVVPILPKQWNCDAYGRPTILAASSFQTSDLIWKFYRDFTSLKCLN